MASITYTAQRKLKTGHSAGTDYTITIDLQQGDAQPAPVQVSNVALAGNTVTVVHRLDETMDIVTDYFATGTTPDFDDMQEFIYSVVHGETFTIDTRDALLVGTPKLSRSGVLFTWSFKLRFLS